MPVEVRGRKVLTYPERIRPLLEKTRDIVFSDGRHVAPSEVWRFMTEEGPERFPHAFDISAQHIGQPSQDVDFISGIKLSYLRLTLRDRMLEARAKGVPLVLIQGGQSMEPYYAAGAIPLRPGFIMFWARDMEEGLSVRQSDFRSMRILERGRRNVTIEACHQIAAHAAVQEGVVDVDLIAPYLCPRCSDMAYLTETHRSGERRFPLQLIDYPVNGQAKKKWAVEYLATALRRLNQSIAERTGKLVADEDLTEEIKKHNKLRGLARRINELWWSAEVPPLNSTDRASIVGLGNEPCGDLTAAIGIIEEALEEISDRVAKGVKGFGLADNPARLYVTGSCVTANPALVDRIGGIVVGDDDQWSETVTEVREEGDPYVNLAKGILSYPYEQSTVERAEWTAEQVKKSRADGLLFIYNWGCNFQSAVARMIADIVKEITGIPTVYLGVGELGKEEATEQSQNRVEAFVEMLRLRKR